MSSVKGGKLVYTIDNNFFAKEDIGGKVYKLINPIDKIISYIPDCGDERGDDDFDCSVMGYQKWNVFDLKKNEECKLTINFFIAKWSTVLNNSTLYNIVGNSYEREGGSNDEDVVDYFEDNFDDEL